MASFLLPVQGLDQRTFILKQNKLDLVLVLLYLPVIQSHEGLIYDEGFLLGQSGKKKNFFGNPATQQDLKGLTSSLLLGSNLKKI